MIAICLRVFCAMGCLLALGVFAKDFESETSDPARLRETADRPRLFAIPQATLPALLANREVRQQIRLDDSAALQVDGVLTLLAARIEDECPFVTLPVHVAMTNEQRAASHNSIRQFIESAVQTAELSLAGILSPEQFHRLEQLIIQREGVVAFRRPEVIQRLQLTRSQQERLGELSSFASTPYAPAAMKATFESGLESILDDTQVQTWRELCGAAFAFSPAPKCAAELRLLDALMGLDPDRCQSPAADERPIGQPAEPAFDGQVSD